MELQDILTKLDGEPEMIQAVSSAYESVGNNEKRVNELEAEIADAVARRKNLHTLVSTVTGLTDLTEDNLKAFAANADEGLKLDNETLQGNLAALQGKYDGLNTSHELEISEMILKDTLRGLGIGDKVQNDRAFTELTRLVMDGAERDGAVFTFKQDGKTLFGEGGNPLNVEGRVSQLMNSEFSYLFKPVSGGGATGGNGGSSQSPDGAKSEEQRLQAKADYAKQYGTLRGFK